MGDMGKLPTSAWLHLWRDGGIRGVLDRILEADENPDVRAEQLVSTIAGVHRVGRKLATLYVSALSTPELAPGLSPWSPAVNGSSLLVVDTHVGQVVDSLRGRTAARTYQARASWLGAVAERLDLSEFGSHLPACSPRLLQQALYRFHSRSNREAWGVACSLPTRCSSCAARSLCPERST